MAKNKKLIATVAAVATSAALLLGGTLAWQSTNQTALNEASDVINPGGRLHDDFDGTNKDVYVENFAEEDIYARIRLEEFFEIIVNHGTDAEKTHSVIGTKKLKDGAVADPENNPSGASLYDYTYVVHKFNTTDNETEDAGMDGDTPYWKWTLGGSTVYMPTFNKNKDSLAADLNGNYVDAVGGISNRDGNQYENYVKYTDGETLEGTEIYDDDANDVDDDGILEVTGIEHIAKPTGSATLMSMQEWIDAGSQPGPYWVYDTDGWVYWADAIKPDSATGLLLDGIELNQKMDDTWYYAINVVAQFVTADDVGKSDGTGFYAEDEAPSAEAEELLRTIGVFSVDDEAGESGEDGGDVGYTETLPVIDFKNDPTESDSVTVYRGTTYSFSSNDTAWGGTWNVWADDAKFTSDGDDHTSTVSTHPEYGTLLLNIAADEPNDMLLCTVTFGGDGGEDCYASIYFKVEDPAEPDSVDTLKEALDKGGVINLGENEFTTGEDDDDVIPSFDNSTTFDYVWTEGGTINGGALVSTSGSSHTLFINNENNWPDAGDANAATMNGTDIRSGSRFAIYAQAVNAPITLNDMSITNNYGGGILAEYTQPITLNNLTVYSASLDDDYAWVNSALAAGMGANVVINGGSYTGTNAVYLLNSGANVTIYDGTFDGKLAVENGTLTICGGTFTVDPTNYVDTENYDVTENDDNTWTVSEKVRGLYTLSLKKDDGGYYDSIHLQDTDGFVSMVYQNADSTITVDAGYTANPDWALPEGVTVGLAAYGVAEDGWEEFNNVTTDTVYAEDNNPYTFDANTGILSDASYTAIATISDDGKTITINNVVDNLIIDVYLLKDGERIESTGSSSDTDKLFNSKYFVVSTAISGVESTDGE